ncbi:FmdB family zinc ribbon protein [Desulfobaculum bizertense]|uniref:Putative regulatory protein, FmdB family n=1 Tax=Desulfobaculum bizertense DSM 18034 TaxID=1121442 RepID=A0A1T4WBR8_9BACT|nr:zinc ribbon domain-containing protein [Desulfobaculum bizertense]UIJ37464.1 zinc ribbon domain-containing protein [Desulfobaculum bizertense]SKA74736.1 putative regulatory protein, FmdB family [Desulfobaculum bizertense DSM 18034]
MPIYEYRCTECNQVFEEWQKNFDEKDMPCPNCGAPSKRLISNTSFVLKGSGWYVTDYCKGGSHGSAKSDVENRTQTANPPKKETAKPAKTSSPQA